MTVPNIISSESQPLLVLDPAVPLVTTVELDLEVPQQSLDNWCWAAVTAGIEAFFGIQSPRAQCRIVTDVLGTGQCCPEETADVHRCNVPHAPQPALRDLFLERIERRDGGTSLAFVVNEIAERQLPFLANLRWNDARVGHLVVISGFHRVGPAVTLIVRDPYTGERSEEPIRAFRQAFRDKGSWRASYRLQRPLQMQ